MILFLVGLLVWGTLLYPVPDNSKTKKVKSAVKNSFYEVTSKLDQGGSLYIYVSTENCIKFVDEFVANLRKIIEIDSSKSGKEETESLMMFDFFYGLIKKSGIMEVSGIGISSIAKEPNLNSSKIVVHRYKEKGKGLLWHLLDEKPHDLAKLKLLPADTVLATFSDNKMKVLWQWIKKEAETSNLPKLKQAVGSVEPLLQMQGISLDKLLDSFAGMSGFILHLDSTKNSVIPVGKTTLEFPEPAIAFVFTVKDDSLFNLLESKLPFAQKSVGENFKKLQIGVPPLPVTIEPVIMQKEGLLIFASNNRIVDAMFAAKRSGNGLIATGEFKKFSAGIPEKGNRFGFVGSRLFRTIKDIQTKIVQASGKENPAAKEFLTLMQKDDKVWTLYGVLQNNNDGFFISMNHTMALETLTLVPAAAAAGIVAAIAIPNLLTATQKGKQKATMGDLKSISTAIEAYIIDHEQAPEGKTLAKIRDKLQPFYIRVLPLKDAWGNDFLYTHGTGDKKDEYAVASHGKDGVFNGWEQTGSYIVTQMEQFGYDIIISNGIFTYGPRIK